jgi:hemolysin III
VEALLHPGGSALDLGATPNRPTTEYLNLQLANPRGWSGLSKGLMINDELANSLTHGFGLALSIVGSYFLLTGTGRFELTGQTIGCFVFGLSLVALYAVSTFYHSVNDQKVKRPLRVIDHACIYLLIAGTYTPFCLTALRGPLGWTLLTVVWSGAVAGIVMQIASRDRVGVRSPRSYVALGWLILLAVHRLFQATGLGGLAWLSAGGFFYTIGLIFFVRDHRRFFHALWHLFALAGSACHYFAVLLYVVRG